jgi:hypothetical protein
MKNMITAQEANRISEENKDAGYTQEAKRVFSGIEENARFGRKELFQLALSLQIQEKLKALGYEVKCQENFVYRISW